jgi:REP element-mobilizing transposase RayT
MIGHHLIFGAYGFWLPNDPRGSWSKFVGSYELYRTGGKATTTDAVESVAHDPHDHQLQVSTKAALSRPAVVFTPIQVDCLGRGFADSVSKSAFVVHACAILSNHVHLVVALHRISIDNIAIQLKAAATRQLLMESLHPFQQVVGKTPKCFAQKKWDVELKTAEQLFHAIDYVEQNPVKAGLPRQHWPFVQPPEFQ